MRPSQIAKFMLQKDSRVRYDGTINVDLTGELSFKSSENDDEITRIYRVREFERFVENGFFFYMEKQTSDNRNTIQISDDLYIYKTFYDVLIYMWCCDNCRFALLSFSCSIIPFLSIFRGLIVCRPL